MSNYVWAYVCVGCWVASKDVTRYGWGNGPSDRLAALTAAMLVVVGWPIRLLVTWLHDTDTH